MYKYIVLKDHALGYCLSREVVCRSGISEYYNILSKDWHAYAANCWVPNFELFKHCVDRFYPEVSEINCLLLT